MRTKRKIAIYMCLLMLATTVFECMPFTRITAQAAVHKYSFEVDGYTSSGEIKDGKYVYKYSAEVEKGQTIDLGKSIYRTCYDEWGWKEYAGDLSGAKWKSSNTGVATVTSKGIVTIKKEGKATITYTLGSEKCTVEYTAVAAGKNSKTVKSDNMIKYAAQIKKAYGTKVTASNRYNLYNYLNAAYYNPENKVSTCGFLKEKRTSSSGYTYATNKLVAPECAYIGYVSKKLEYYSYQMNPIGTTSSKWFTISSLSGKAGKSDMTMKVSKAVTSDQIYAIQHHSGWDTYMAKAKKAEFSCFIKDKTTGRRYKCLATAVEGSKELKIKVVNATLIKGRKYQLAAYWGGEENTWTRGKSFTAK